MKNGVPEISGNLPFAILQPHSGCVCGKERRAASTRKGALGGRDRSVRSGRESLLCWEKGQAREGGRGRDGSSETRVPIPLLERFLGNWVPHLPPSPLGIPRALKSPMVSEAVSPGRGGSGRGSHLEASERSHVFRGASVHTCGISGCSPPDPIPTQAHAVGLWATQPSAEVSQGCLSH